MRNAQWRKGLFVLGLALVLAIPAFSVEPAPTGQKLSLYELYMAGGPVMHVISALSVFALVLGIWFFFVLRPSHLVSEEIVRKVWSLLSDGNVNDARVLCERVNGLVPRVFLAGLKRAGASTQQIQHALQAAGEREAARLSRNVRYLSEIATLSPMLGLLGTVIGLVQSFSWLAQDPALRRPDMLAAGVYTALVTTAWGLIVAVPATAMFFYFRAKVQYILLLVEQLAEELSDKLVSQPSRWESR